MGPLWSRGRPHPAPAAPTSPARRGGVKYQPLRPFGPPPHKWGGANSREWGGASVPPAPPFLFRTRLLAPLVRRFFAIGRFVVRRPGSIWGRLCACGL